MHPLVLERLQEGAEPREVVHPRRLGQPRPCGARPQHAPHHAHRHAPWGHVVEDRLQGLHRRIEELRKRPDADARLGKGRAQGGQVLGLDLLEPRRPLAQVGRRVAVERHDPAARDDAHLRVGILGDVPAQKLAVAGAELEALPLPPRVPDQVAQEHLGVVVADSRVVGQRPGIARLPPLPFDAVGGEQVAVDARARRPREPRLPVEEQLGEALEDRIGSGGDAVLPALARVAALHPQPRPAPPAPLHGLGEDAVDLGRVGLGRHGPPALAEEHRIEPLGMGPDLARHEAVRPAQELEVVVVEDVRLALVVELRQRERPAFDARAGTGLVAPGQRLEIALVGDPDLPEISVERGPLGVGQDRLQRGAREAPPLRAHVRHDARGDAPPEPQPPLDRHPAVEEPALPPPGEGEAQREAFLRQPAHRPGHVRRGRRFDEVRPRPRREVVAQGRHRPQRQAGAGGKIDVARLREARQHRLAGLERRRDDPPGAPFAAVARREDDARGQIAQPPREGVMRRLRHRAVHMDDHRAAPGGPVADYLLGAVERGMHEHHDADRDGRAHAQFPLDMSPRISSWRQLMYCSLQGVQRSSPSPSRPA
jgi:hypothetical protein